MAIGRSKVGKVLSLGPGPSLAAKFVEDCAHSLDGLGALFGIPDPLKVSFQVGCKVCIFILPVSQHSTATYRLSCPVYLKSWVWHETRPGHALR